MTPTPPHPGEHPVPFVTVTNWVRAANLCGIDIGRIFHEEGVDMRNLHPETAVIQRVTIQRVMQRCVEETRAQNTGLYFPLVLGETFAFEYMSDVETFITTSPTLREAARSLEWIPPLVNPYMQLTLAEHGHEARMAVSFAHPEAGADNTRYFTEGVFASLQKFTRRLLGGQPLFARVTFQHERDADSATCEAFFQSPVRYGQPVSALWFDRALLDLPLRGGFPMLHEQAAQRVAQKVAERHEQQQHEADAGAPAPTTTLVDQIDRVLDHKPRLLGLGLEALAEELDLHPRTLQRRLRELGESHSGILDRVRYRLSRQYLDDPGRSIEDISERLGFSDRRSFTQAFARWSGTTPSQYRRGAQDVAST